jgi:predicted hydrocarbon binding protein
MIDLVDTLTLDKGRISLSTIPFAIFLTKSIYYVQEELKKCASDSWKKILYESGKTDAYLANSSYLRICSEDRSSKDLLTNSKKAFEFLALQYNKIGKGEVRIEYDQLKSIGRVILKYSPIASEYVEHGGSKEPQCYYFAGVYAGSMSIFHPGVEAKEIKCLSQGYPYCEFIVTLPKK